MRTALLTLLLAAGAAPAIEGQGTLEPRRDGVGPRQQEAAGSEARGRFAWLRPLASIAVPGSGQLLAGQDRGVLYIAAEAVFLTRFFSARAEAGREADRFHELAYSVARNAFEPVLRDTTFEYFEQMGKFIESGPFDTDPGPALVPPTDERTFNGSLWGLARRTFLPDTGGPPDPESEEYVRALEFYRERAVGPNFQWSWRNAGLEQDLFRQAIRRSDESFRRATTQLGLLLANHLLSAVDAYVSLRLSGNGRPVRLTTLLWQRDRGSDVGWVGVLSVGF